MRTPARSSCFAATGCGRGLTRDDLQRGPEKHLTTNTPPSQGAISPSPGLPRNAARNVLVVVPAGEVDGGATEVDRCGQLAAGLVDI